MSGNPQLLTVEEAARLLRVGRTKAYAMAREWRDTGGRSGLPVVDFGHVLRVPLHQLEVLVGGPLGGDVDAVTATVKASTPRSTVESAAPVEPATAPTAPTAPSPSPKPSRHNHHHPTNQLHLFNPPPSPH